MSEFDSVRRRALGAAAKESVMNRLAGARSPIATPVSEFDAIRNRPAFQQPLTITVPNANPMMAPEKVTPLDFLRAQNDFIKNYKAPAKSEPVGDPVDSFLSERQADNKSLPWAIRGTLNNVDRFLYKGPGRFLIRPGQAALKTTTGLSPEDVGTPTVSTGSKIGDTAADIAGMIGGIAANPAQIPGGMISAPYNAPITNTIANAIGRRVSSPIASRAATEASREALAGAYTGVGQSLMTGDTDPGDMAVNTALGVGLGAAAGAAGPYASQALRSIVAKIKPAAKVAAPEAEPLMLMPPRQRGNANTAQGADVVYGKGEVAKPLPLPSGEALPQNLRVAGSTQTLNRAMQEITPFVTERMTPPLENPTELARWIQSNIGDSVSMNEIRKLSYEDMRQVADMIKDRIDIRDVARQVARERGYNLDDLFEGYTPSILDRVDQNAAERVAGIYPDSLPNIKKPVLQREVLGQAMFDQRVGRAPKAVSPIKGRVENAKTQSPAAVTPLRPQSVNSPEINVNRQMAADYLRTNPKAPVSEVQRLFKLGYTDIENIRAAIHEGKPFMGFERYYQAKSTETPSSQISDFERRTGTKPEEVPFDMTEPPGSLSALDDIEIDPENVAPRIRDRLSGYGDSLIASAKAELARNRNRLSSNPVDHYVQYAKIGAGYMLKGTVKLADFTEAMIKDFGEELRPHMKEIWKLAKVNYANAKKQIESESLGLTGFEGQELKDLSSLNLNTADVYRNFKKVFGKYYPEVKAAVLDPFDAAKAAYAKEQQQLFDDLHKDIVQKLGIKKGSKMSADVQRYGEGELKIDDIKALYPNDKWKDIVRADQWFRQRYDSLIDRVNSTVAKIYPNNPEKLVPRRQDYYRHFKDMSAWSGIKNLFDSASGAINPHLAGMSPFTQPKTKWASFKQKRGLGEFKNDAVGGFLDYVPAASYAIHIDPSINVFRNLAKRLAEDTEQTKNLNNFIRFLQNFANDLSGKTSPLDRWVEDLDPFKSGGGRKALRLMTQINGRVKSNVILGNVRSTLSQLANIPNAIAYGGIDAPQGALRTVMSAFEPNPAMQESNFLKERYLNTRKFTRWWEQPKRAAEAMMAIADRVGSSFVWNTAYTKGLRQGVDNPVKFADEETRRLIAGRGIGETPLLFKSKLGGLVAPFQLEVNNLWRIMKDFVDEKQFGALATLFVTNWLLNEAFKKTTGSGVVFDPIDAFVAAATDDATPLERGGRIAGEVLSNLPLGQTIASLYKENGMNILGVDLPSREKLFGDKDPTRFGSGLIAAGAISDPLFKLVLPFGGSQLKKTIQGTDAVARKGVYTENFLTTGPTIEDKKLKYPVAMSPFNVGRSVLFSPNATSEGQQYNNNDRRPLSEKQTKVYDRSADPSGYYDRLMAKRKRETEKAKAKK